MAAGQFEFVQVVGIVSGVMTVAGLGWWLSGRFAKLTSQIRDTSDDLKDRISEAKESLETKFAAHEKLDDTRFNQLDLKILTFELREQSTKGFMGPQDIG